MASSATIRTWWPVYRIETPEGWSSLEAYLADLAPALVKLHRFHAHPLGQSLRHGSQTQQSLSHSSDPAIKAFFQAIDAPIRRHIAWLGEGDDPLRSRITGGYGFNGVWSVRLRPSGFHADHLHPEGWLSSACYIALPPAIEREPRGLDRIRQAGRAHHAPSGGGAFRQAGAGPAGAVPLLHVARHRAVQRPATAAYRRLRRAAGLTHSLRWRKTCMRRPSSRDAGDVGPMADRTLGRRGFAAALLAAGLMAARLASGTDMTAAVLDMVRKMSRIPAAGPCPTPRPAT